MLSTPLIHSQAGSRQASKEIESTAATGETHSSNVTDKSTQESEALAHSLYSQYASNENSACDSAKSIDKSTGFHTYSTGEFFHLINVNSDFHRGSNKALYAIINSEPTHIGYSRHFKLTIPSKEDKDYHPKSFTNLPLSKKSVKEFQLQTSNKPYPTL